MKLILPSNVDFSPQTLTLIKSLPCIFYMCADLILKFQDNLKWVAIAPDYGNNINYALKKPEPGYMHSEHKHQPSCEICTESHGVVYIEHVKDWRKVCIFK